MSFWGFNMGKRENDYQSGLKKRLREAIPGCIILKNDPTDIQGIADLTILYKDKWATLEVKRSENATHRPNQDWYVNKMNEMSYSAFIYPENEEGIIHEIQQAFGIGR